MANREKATEWETFTLIEQEDGKVGIKALVNGKFASIDIGKWSLGAKCDNYNDENQKFEVCFTFFDSELIGLKSCATQKYLCMPDDQNHPVSFWDGSLSRRSMFRVENFEPAYK